MKYGRKVNLRAKTAPFFQNWLKTTNFSELKNLLQKKKFSQDARSCQKIEEELVKRLCLSLFDWRQH